MTYKELSDALAEKGIDSPELDACLLLEHFFSVRRAVVLSDPARDYDSPAFRDAVSRRLSREPLQYILGEWDFYRQRYKVNSHCLIPRSDTEILVEEAIRRLPRDAVFADLCTGSGCIAVSVLAERPDTRAIAADKFEETLALATVNAHRNGVGERFTPLLCDVLEEAFFPENTLLDAILCNPPYIASLKIDGLSPEVQREPRAALDGGEDGLVFYRHLLKTQRTHLKPEGFFLFEIGYDQGEALLSLSQEYGFATARILRDLGGNDRVAYITHQERNHA